MFIYNVNSNWFPYIWFPYYHNAFVFILQEKSGVPLVAQEIFSEPKEVEVLFNADGVDLLTTSYTTKRSPC